MRRALAVALLAVPTVLAFFDGGYGEPARLVAGIGVWLLVAIGALTAPVPFPQGVAARAAVGGLAALLVLTLVSLSWAPLLGPAYGDAQRLALYLGALIAALALLGPARATEPLLAAGAWVVVLAGLSERIAPGLVTLDRSLSAGGRLEQPLGYWNAMGALAAMGLTLCAGIAGDALRAAPLRIAAATGAPLLGAGVALSFSRGALLCVGAGLLALLLARPLRAQLRAVGIAAGAAAAAGVLAASLPDVAELRGGATQGAVLGAGILLAGVAAALTQVAALRAERAGRRSTAALPRPRGRAAAAVIVALLGLGGAALLGSDPGSRTGTPGFGADAGRLSSTQSNRIAYWDVALATWADHPLLGAGSSAFGVRWLRDRTVAEGARDAHSLPIETAAELGLLGLLALGALVGGVVAAALRAPPAVAGSIGGLAAWAVHAAVDWAWEMPAVTLLALLLAGSVLAAGRPRGAGAAPS